MRSATRRHRKRVDSDRLRKRGPPIYRPSSRSGRRRCYGCRRAATTAAECERVVGVLLGGCCIGLGCANGPHCTWFLTAFGSIAVLFLCCCFFAPVQSSLGRFRLCISGQLRLVHTCQEALPAREWPRMLTSSCNHLDWPLECGPARRISVKSGCGVDRPGGGVNTSGPAQLS